MGLFDSPLGSFEPDTPINTDTSQPVSRKDEITSMIAQLEEKRQQLLTEHADALEKETEQKAAKDAAKKAYEEAKQKLSDEETKLMDASRSVSDTRRTGLRVREDLEKLRRELSRLLDAEQINAKFLAQLDEFKAKCLDAVWRGENREDGYGAFPYQIEGAILLAVAGSALLGDRRGLGKSLTSLIYCDLVEAEKVIVIVPSDTQDNFLRELKMWAPHRNILKIGGQHKLKRDMMLSMLADEDQWTIVLNYEAWRRDDQLIPDLIALNADTLLLDEAHRIKEMKTHTCKGVMNLRFAGNICPKCDNPDVAVDRNEKNGNIENGAICVSCDYSGPVLEFCSIKRVLTMTGTPILNRPQELFPILKLIDIENFNNLDYFLRDFCRLSIGGHWTWNYGAEEKLIKMIGPRWLSRDRKSAGVVVPPASTVKHLITRDEMKERYPRQYRAYEEVRRYAQIVFETEKGMAASSIPAYITVLLRLRQVITWPAQIHLKYKDPDNQNIVVDQQLDVHESIKLDKAEELVREIIAEGDRVIVFSQFKGPLRELQRRCGDRTVVYDGDTPKPLRDEIQLDFDVKTMSENTRWDAVFGNYKAMGVGLNFTGATHVIMLDREWNPGMEEQAGGRIDRIGQSKDTYIHLIEVDPSVDSWLSALIYGKSQMLAGFEEKANIYQQMRDALTRGEI